MMGMPEVQMVQKLLDKYKTVLQRVVKPITWIQPTALKSVNYRLLEANRVFGGEQHSRLDSLHYP